MQNVNYTQSVLQRMLQIGDVDFDTAAGDDYNFIFDGVADPADVVHMVDQATGIGAPDRARRRARQRSGSRRADAQAGAPARLGLEARGLAQGVGAVGALPGEVVVVTAEVAVGGRLLVDRPVQAQLRRGTSPGAGRSARATSSAICPRPIFSVPNVSTISETGCATPIA